MGSDGKARTEGPTRAYAGAKGLIHLGFVETFETQSESEIHSISEMASTDNTKETIRAFNEKRTPVFKGRRSPRRRHEAG